MPVKSIEKQILDRGVLGNMPNLGKWRKGGEAGEKSPGKDLTYFRLTLEPEYEHIRPDVERICGSQPTALRNVMIAADSPDKALDYWYEEWSHAKLVNRCDEETVVVHWNENAGGYSSQPHACTCNPMNRSCGLVGRVKIVIPELCEAIGVWGTFTVLTGSIYDVTALRASMHVAGAFMQRIQNVAFWSVPFEIGRVTRKVPVTINGKRSIKPMSLLYAQVEPDFNQKVLSPMLTAPAQMLLAGGNPETGEMPEVVIEQAAAWDRDYVSAQTGDLFDHENHQANAIDKLIADGILTDDMTDDEAVIVIQAHRAQREAEKQGQQAGKDAPKTNEKAQNTGEAESPAPNDVNWVKNPQAVASFVSTVMAKLNGFNHGRIVSALSWTMPRPINAIEKFIGSQNAAWAACVVDFCDYRASTVEDYIPDPDNVIRKLALDMIQNHDIPF